jgi:hypothetical protein
VGRIKRGVGMAANPLGAHQAGPHVGPRKTREQPERINCIRSGSCRVGTFVLLSDLLITWGYRYSMVCLAIKAHPAWHQMRRCPLSEESNALRFALMAAPDIRALTR